MSGFCVRKIDIDSRLRPQDGVIRMQDLELTTDARALADDILAQARAEAEQIREQAEHEARERAREAEADTLRRAAALLATLELANATLVDRARDVVIDMVHGLYDRLAAQTTPRKRIEASLARILREAPPRLTQPVLRVHPDDVGLLPEVEWEVRRDPSLARGACRLEAATGQWQADFDASVEALRLAFTAATEGTGQGTTEPDA